MKRAKGGTESLVYAYGVVLAPAPSGVRPCPLDSAPVRRELARMHDMWDRLVDAWRDHESAERAAALDEGAQALAARARTVRFIPGGAAQGGGEIAALLDLTPYNLRVLAAAVGLPPADAEARLRAPGGLSLGGNVWRIEQEAV